MSDLKLTTDHKTLRERFPQWDFEKNDFTFEYKVQREKRINEMEVFCRLGMQQDGLTPEESINENYEFSCTTYEREELLKRLKQKKLKALK